MSGRATIYDVAALAGVSITTVSMALNRPSRVNPVTRDRVLAAVDELEFVPKAAAVIQARKGVGRIGVLAPFTSYESYGRRLNGVLEQAADRVMDIVVWDQESAAVATSPLLSSVPVTRRLDGLLIMGLPLEDSVVARLLQRDLATVLVDATRPEFSSVVIDDEEGGYLVGRHFLDRGHTSFAAAVEAQLSTDYVSPAQLRRAGLLRAITEAGLPPESLNTVETTNDIAGGRSAVGSLIESGALPTAIFGHDDVVAAGILAELRHRGIRVPADVAVMGFDDGSLAEALDLTTVRQPLEESGRIGAQLLFAAMRGETTSVRRVNLGLTVVTRATT